MPSILVVDDSREICEHIEVKVSSAGYEVVGIAYDGVEALRKIIELKPDIVLMDLVMPVSDGFELLFQISELRLQAKVIVVSAYPAGFQRAILSGAHGYLTKPFETEGLFKSIEDVLKGALAFDNLMPSQITLPSPLRSLSLREMQALTLLSQQKGTEEIRSLLGLGPKAPSDCMDGIKEKLGGDRAPDLTALAKTLLPLG